VLPFSPRGAHRRDGASLEAIRFRLTRPFIDRPAAVVRDTQNGEGRESLRGDYEAAQTDGVTFADYLDVVRRHRWFIILMGIGVAVGVAVFTARQAQDYKASAQVIELGATGPTGLNSTEIDRRAQTDASLARTPLLAAKVLQATGTKESTDDFLSHSSVNAAASSDVLTFTVKDAKAALAVNLVNAYARGFAKYRTDVGQAAFNRAKESLEANIETIEAQLEQARAAANGSPSPTVSVLSQRYRARHARSPRRPAPRPECDRRSGVRPAPRNDSLLRARGPRSAHPDRPRGQRRARSPASRTHSVSAAVGAARQAGHA
jgi:capsular polysaccharide biosynthesis protein